MDLQIGQKVLVVCFDEFQNETGIITDMWNDKYAVVLDGYPESDPLEAWFDKSELELLTDQGEQQ